MKPVSQILQTKSDNSVYAVAPDARVHDALQLMAEKGVGALLVMDGPEVLGILSERDYARKVELRGRSSRETPVTAIMSAPVIVVRPDQSNEQCMALMTENRLRHLPVVDNGKLVGLISIGDLVKDIISEQQYIIEQLQHYIRGEVSVAGGAYQ
ncbi:MAG TPA: CBS domain-containing protein [Noviherbaspirillum sp.]|jgi:CBS domain-containing protein|uniref:CBS domain-containing protein n=1 Tax=Noviherbaspirillum sp. TaxID=1926288 RepID=UPI002F955BF9